jgi:hypothetical protein
MLHSMSKYRVAVVNFEWGRNEVKVAWLSAPARNAAGSGAVPLSASGVAGNS